MTGFSPIPGNTMMSLEDMYDKSEDLLQPLRVMRVYSAYIHKRHTMGPMGKGWLLKLW